MHETFNFLDTSLSQQRITVPTPPFISLLYTIYVIYVKLHSHMDNRQSTSPIQLSYPVVLCRSYQHLFTLLVLYQCGMHNSKGISILSLYTVTQKYT